MLFIIINFFCVFFLSFLGFTVNAQLSGQWPQVDVPPPTNDEWTKLVDQSSVPKAPISKSLGDCGLTNDFCNWSCGQCIRENDIIQCPNVHDWGLTFDDGPSLYTDSLLDYLASKQLKLTFFVVGSRVYENPQILKKAVDAGHQIGVHTWSHTALTTQTNEEVIAEIKWTEQAIVQAAGITPKYMRPPYGDIDDRVRGILSQLGYKVVIWDKDTNDWRSFNDPTFQFEWVEGNFTEWVKEVDPTGHISLEHDLRENTAAQVPKVVSILQGAEFNIKSVADCIGDLNPYQSVQSPAPGPAPNPTSPTSPTATTVAVVTVTQTPSDDAKAYSSDQDYTSNAISYMNNMFLLSLVLIVGPLYYMIAR